MKEILAKSGEESIVADKLSEFKCAINPFTQHFIQRMAIPYEKAHKCRTYLIIDGRSSEIATLQILAFVSVAISMMKFQPYVTKTMKKRLTGIFRNNEAPCYLIGQLGKNDQYSDEIGGSELIEHAMSVIQVAQNAVGGRFVRVDVSRNDKLTRFYEQNDFIKVQMDEDLNLIQFVRFF